MARLIGSLVAGILFGIGLTVSQMVNPAKVLAFLDVAGRWDPSLALVMASGLGVALIGFRLTLRRPVPLLAERFELPGARAIDRPLVAGAALFGIGWGLVGFCPGPAFASLAFGLKGSFIFVAAMLAGAWLHKAVSRRPGALPIPARARYAAASPPDPDGSRTA